MNRQKCSQKRVSSQCNDIISKPFLWSQVLHTPTHEHRAVPPPRRLGQEPVRRRRLRSALCATVGKNVKIVHVHGSPLWPSEIVVEVCGARLHCREVTREQDDNGVWNVWWTIQAASRPTAFKVVSVCAYAAVPLTYAYENNGPGCALNLSPVKDLLQRHTVDAWTKWWRKTDESVLGFLARLAGHSVAVLHWQTAVYLDVDALCGGIAEVFILSKS